MLRTDNVWGVRAAGLVLSSILFVGCASLQARTTYSRGVKARDSGELRAAIAAFEEAYRKDPKAEYGDALRKAKAEVARGEVRQAEAAEAVADFATAAKHWGNALELAPENGGLMARKGLAELEARSPDPVERYKGIAKLANVAPKDRVVHRKLQSAKRGALQYHLRMARMYTDVRSYRQAYRAYEDARAIEPKNPIFEGSLYRDVKVRELETVGDQKLAAGDTLAAYEAYEAAVKVRPSRRLKNKMSRAKRGAGPVIEQMRQAEVFVRMSKWEDAAEIYSVLMGRKEAPAEVRTQATQARQKSAQIRAERATAYAVRGLVNKAVAELRLALDHTDGPVDAIKATGATIDALDAERPNAAREALAGAKPAGAALPVVVAADGVIVQVAKRLFARAQARAGSEPGEALLLMTRLSSFEKELPGYAGQRKKLVKTAFLQLVDSATGHADAGRFSAATERLASALSIAKPPASLAEALQTGLEALKAEDWLRGRDAFSKAVAQSGRSRLAKAGLGVAEKAHLVSLRAEARDARAVDDPVRASAAYRGILELDPEDLDAKAALQELKDELVAGALSKAAAHAGGGRPGSAFVYFRRVLVLDPDNAEAKAGLDKLAPQLGGGKTGRAWVAPLQRGDALQDRCRGVERAARERIALYLTRTPGLGVEFLEAKASEEIDNDKAPPPPVQLGGRVVDCAPTKTGGTLGVEVRLSSGPTVIFTKTFSAEFDPKSVPKDELESGLAARQVVMSLLGKVAKEVSLAVKKDAGRLAGWRVVLAQDRMKAGDAEGAALAYATLLDAKDGLSTEERSTLDALERYLNNRFR